MASCSSAIEAQQFLNQTDVDLMFLDIEMPVLKDIDSYQNLRSKPKAICTAAYRDYVVLGFKLDAVDYLLKPFIFSRFLKTIEKFKASQSSNPKLTPVKKETEVKKQTIFVKENRKQVKLILNRIYYVQGLKDFLKIITINGSYVIKRTLSGFGQLPSQFLRIHASYIINKDHVSAYNRQEVEIDQHEIPIGESYHSLFPI